MFSRALAKLDKKINKAVKKKNRSSGKPDGILTRVSEESLQDLKDGNNTSGCDELKDSNQEQDSLPSKEQGQFQEQEHDPVAS